MILLHATGNLGDDATLNKAGEKTVINFNIATNESWKNKNGEKESETRWIDCAYFGENEQLLKMLKKGALVSVFGTPNTKVHYRKQDGMPIAVQYLKVNKIEVLSK